MFKAGAPEPGDPGPFFYRPDPERPSYAAAKATKLVRRAPCEFYLVGRKLDGETVRV